MQCLQAGFPPENIIFYLQAAEEVAAKAAELSQDIEKHINRLLGKMRPRRNRPGTAENAEPEASADEAEK